MTLLQTKKLAISYGGIKAVKGIDLEIQQGELVCLIGANGAGKSTTLNALCSALPVTSGEILYQGQPITRAPSHALVRKGIALVPEGRGIFGRLTVEENLQMGAYIRKDHSVIKQDMAHIYEIFPRLLERRTQKAGTLSGGEQQMLALGRAMMSRPQLLLLDEPSMGLAPLMVKKIFETIRQIASEGVTILLVEQNARLALEVSQRAYVMENGLITLTGLSSELLHDPQVQQAYLGH
jgi:branched-chain amino acid transport system ATP-binding protein